jgi:hypothetical protein
LFDHLALPSASQPGKKQVAQGDEKGATAAVSLASHRSLPSAAVIASVLACPFPRFHRCCSLLCSPLLLHVSVLFFFLFASLSFSFTGWRLLAVAFIHNLSAFSYSILFVIAPNLEKKIKNKGQAKK